MSDRIISQIGPSFVVMCVGRNDDELDDGGWTERHFFATEEEAIANAKEQARDSAPLDAVVFKLTPILKACRGKIRIKRIESVP